MALAAQRRPAQPQRMFSVTEAEATAIRAAYDTGGELAAAIELRRFFPGISDMANARRCVRMIAGWTIPTPPPKNG